MKQFQYSLQAVRTLRERQEQIALQNYGNALRASEEAEEKLAEVQLELEATWEELQNLFAHQATAEHLARVQAYSQDVETRRQDCERVLRSARRKVREEFLKLVAARQASAVLEKHHDAQRKAHVRRQRRHEQKILDDLVGRQNVIQVEQWEKPAPLWN